MARTKKAAAADTAPSGKAWAYGIRTWDKGGISHAGFTWNLAAEACTEAPDWDPKPVCGYGLHANQDGWGDWSLLNLGEVGKVLGIVRWDPAEAVDIDGGQKTKAKRMWVVMTTETASLGAIYQYISDRWKARMTSLLAEQAEKVAAASRAGEHASATGVSGIGASLGGGMAKAAETGAIVLTRWDDVGDTYKLIDIAAGMVGQELRGVMIEAATDYVLTTAGVVKAESV